MPDGRLTRRAEALGSLYEARLRGLPDSGRVGGLRSVSQGLWPDGRLTRRAEALGSLYEARLRGLPDSGRVGGLRSVSQGL